MVMKETPMKSRIILIAALCVLVAVTACPAAASGLPVDMDGMLRVLDAAGPEYDGLPLNNETIAASFVDQVLQEQSYASLDTRYPELNNHYSNDFKFTIQGGRQAYLLTPFPASPKKNGRATTVRNITFRARLPVGVNITAANVWSGDQLVNSSSVVRRGTGSIKTYVVDMGSRKPIPNGVHLALIITNTKTVNDSVRTYGATLLQEW